ncbi:RmlC-like jelly roll fold,Popeye protein [Cinara cedri]|uniref:RmlC-like jelly roll fold,Popeye protein n=1 Tax=Cinara cedri TaxID=506608 RepID=A0A5E4NF92_9HEMI|nr:RmlC-like jelly roll fold,Popeye protein [Cinara cedri]
MGHHNNTTVESANNAYAPLATTTTALQRDAIVSITTVGAATATERNNSHGNTRNSGNGNNGATTTAVGVAPVVVAMHNGTPVPDRSASDYYYYYAYDNVTDTALFFPLNGTTAGRPNVPFEKPTCAWIPTQQSLFQFSNICFLTAFIVPRSYKFSLLSLRALLFVGFIISGLWSSTDVCAVDALIWYALLALINGVHTLKLCKKLLPPALSVELMELYVRVFKPLKVSQKHFRELTREAIIVEMTPGECYAVEEVTACDERLSILLRGRCSVTCEGTQLHNINSYQFIDSPEWMASSLMHGESMFQVTITAAEDSVYLCWQLSKLNRIFKHRTQLHAVLASIIGKDVTHKMYSLNEQLGQAKSFDDQSRAARNDHWRQAIYRSVSYDAVNTGTKGTVRSNVWKRYRDRKQPSLFTEPPDSPVHGPRKCWIPVMSAQMSNSTTAYASMDGHSLSAATDDDDERQPMLPTANSGDIQLYRLDSRHQPLSAATAAVALIPVIVPVVSAAGVVGLQLNAAGQPAAQQLRRPGSLRRHNSGASNGGGCREVKFDETVL